MSVKFRATLPDGSVVVGPIRGNGGQIGDASMHLGIETAREHAAEIMARVVRLRSLGRCTFVYEPEPGHVAIFREFSAKSDGPPVHVPILWTKFEVVV